ncbi:MAG: respiratory nitrate reductase subunit gamma [Proteobacteria bacterium]|nr:respiratory nitrate reductase subunit gamma [Pseudomonadota bacterium]MBU2227365.1 respiratory nitrate reductase subunit gamma [Pseudomonadota bacterium]MBU2262197.1 respiratory nitrate reductase subunit gamma [Pseudomonadota bacterium]
MNTFKFIVGAILPYVVVPAFVAGMSYRIWTWLKSPQPAKMTLFPAGGSTFREVLVEVLLFPSLFRGDRVLWFLAWFFHATLALVFLGHIRVFTGAIDRMLEAAGMTPKGLDLMSGLVGGAAGILLLAIGLLLLLRRIALPRVREITGIPDVLATLLVVVIIVTGDLLRFSAPFDLEQTRVWAASLLSFSPVIPTNEMFLLHLALSQVLIMFIPFSKILHFGGIFFTQTLIKRR